MIRYLCSSGGNRVNTFSFCEGCPWSWSRPVQIGRSNWVLEGVGKFCGNGETGESQRRRQIPKSAASGQILQIGGNGEGPRRAVGENAMSCPRLSSSVLATSSSSSSSSPLTNPADPANQSPYWGKSHLWFKALRQEGFKSELLINLWF